MISKGQAGRLLGLLTVGVLVLALAVTVRSAGAAPMALPSPGPVYEALAEATVILAVVVAVLTVAVIAWVLWHVCRYTASVTSSGGRLCPRIRLPSGVVLCGDAKPGLEDVS